MSLPRIELDSSGSKDLFVLRIISDKALTKMELSAIFMNVSQAIAKEERDAQQLEIPGLREGSGNDGTNPA